MKLITGLVLAAVAVFDTSAVSISEPSVSTAHLRKLKVAIGSPAVPDISHADPNKLTSSIGPISALTPFHMRRLVLQSDDTEVKKYEMKDPVTEFSNPNTEHPITIDINNVPKNLIGIGPVVPAPVVPPTPVELPAPVVPAPVVPAPVVPAPVVPAPVVPAPVVPAPVVPAPVVPAPVKPPAPVAPDVLIEFNAQKKKVCKSDALPPSSGEKGRQLEVTTPSQECPKKVKVCGTDGKPYDDVCKLARASCDDKLLKPAADTMCMQKPA